MFSKHPNSENYTQISGSDSQNTEEDYISPKWKKNDNILSSKKIDIHNHNAIDANPSSSRKRKLSVDEQRSNNHEVIDLTDDGNADGKLMTPKHSSYLDPLSEFITKMKARNEQVIYEMLTTNNELVRQIQELRQDYLIELIKMVILKSSRGNNYCVDQFLEIIQNKYHRSNDLQYILQRVYAAFKYENSIKYKRARDLLEEYTCDFGLVISLFLRNIKKRNYGAAFEMLKTNVELVKQIQELRQDHLITLIKILIKKSNRANKNYFKHLLEIIKNKYYHLDEFHYILLGVYSIFEANYKKYINFIGWIDYYMLGSENIRLLNKLINIITSNYCISLILDNDTNLRERIQSLNEAEATRLVIVLFSKTEANIGMNSLIEKCLLLINNVNVINKLFDCYTRVNINEYKYNDIMTMLNKCFNEITKNRTHFSYNTNSFLPSDFNQQFGNFPKPNNINDPSFFFEPYESYDHVVQHNKEQDLSELHSNMTQPLPSVPQLETDFLNYNENSNDRLSNRLPEHSSNFDNLNKTEAVKSDSSWLNSTSMFNTINRDLAGIDDREDLYNDLYHIEDFSSGPKL